MKHVLTALALVAMTTSAHAQSASGSGTATANAAAQAASGSIAGGGSVNITNTGGGTQRYDGSYDLRNVPAVQPPGFGSGHPCALSPVSLGVGWVGAGASAGGQIVDDACLLAQMGEKRAATYMIAGRNEAACRALKKAGRISSASDCNHNGRADTPAPVTTTSTKSVAMEVKCVGKVPHVTAKVAAAYSKRQLAAQCK